MPPPERSDIHVVLGIVRLAHKYDMEYLFRRALQHLTHHQIVAGLLVIDEADVSPCLSLELLPFRVTAPRAARHSLLVVVPPLSHLHLFA
ncbi:hypothetical protein DFH09DRAFT_1349558 [Mycena vulgaris]|nr:hypothetical protein DFH09DRAFT_1349558 [Mycena vulgaris]